MRRYATMLSPTGYVGKYAARNYASRFRNSGRALSASLSLLDAKKKTVKDNFIKFANTFSTTTTTSSGNATSSVVKTLEKKDEVEKTPVTIVDEVKPPGRVRELWRKYGIVFVVTYGSVYLVSLSTMYELVAFKIIDAHAAMTYLHSLGIDQFMDLTPIATSKAGNFALAWVLTKFTEPIRLAFTVTVTPSIARLVGRRTQHHE